jgi:V8-like Glu-specific endopeptidase
MRLPAISGGAPTAIATAPWDVALIQRDTLCSGSLISPIWVLTAAHCMKGVQAGDIAAYSGLSDITQRGPANQMAVVGVFTHPQWDPATYANDLALLQLQTPVAQSANVRVIPLPDSADPATWPAKGSAAGISGWGSTSVTGQASSVLQGASVQVLGGPADSQCGKYGSSFSSTRSICAGMPAGGIDTCQGDSGSGLVVALGDVPTLAGVTSAGEGCAEADFPGIYTRVTSYLPWIRQYVPAPVAPAPPPNVAVQALSKGRALVSWSAPGAPAPFSVTVSPSSKACTTPSSPACLVEGLAPGQSYTASVMAAGGVAIGESLPFTAVAGSGRVGAQVPSTQVARWAGRSVSGRISMRVSGESAASCHVAGRRLVLDAAGLCVARVVQGGKPGVAYIGVTA